jgi:predicted nucleotidyltransferase
MRPSEALSAHRAEVRQIVAAHHAANARVFGSTVRGEDRDDSDLDLLADPTAETTLLDIARIPEPPAKAFGRIRRRVDAQGASGVFSCAGYRRSGGRVKKTDLRVAEGSVRY